MSFKTLRIDINDSSDRNAIFDRVCELKCLNKKDTKSKYDIKGPNIGYDKLVEFLRKESVTFYVEVEVEEGQATGKVVESSPESIKNTPVDQVSVIEDENDPFQL